MRAFIQPQLVRQLRFYQHSTPFLSLQCFQKQFMTFKKRFRNLRCFYVLFSQAFYYAFAIAISAYTSAAFEPQYSMFYYLCLCLFFLRSHFAEVETLAQKVHFCVAKKFATLMGFQRMHYEAVIRVCKKRFTDFKFSFSWLYPNRNCKF